MSYKGLTTSRAFFVGDVNIFGMRLFIQIRYFFVNNRSVFVLGLQNGVTVIWVPSCFVYPILVSLAKQQICHGGLRRKRTVLLY